MKIEAYLIVWNEIEILPLVIKHYKKFCSSITIYDNYSDDGSDVLAESMGCKVIKYGTPGELNDQDYMDVKNNCWKGSDADYVIVCDCDEILTGLWAPGSECGVKRPTIYKTQGWQITSNAMPNQDLFEITNGFYFNNYSKNVFFDPKAIKEINYNPGAHRCDPVGDVVWSDETLFLFHYRQIGGVDRLIKRYKQYMSRMSPINRKKGWGIHYKKPKNQIIADWRADLLKSRPFQS